MGSIIGNGIGRAMFGGGGGHGAGGAAGAGGAGPGGQEMIHSPPSNQSSLMAALLGGGLGAGGYYARASRPLGTGRMALMGGLGAGTGFLINSVVGGSMVPAGFPQAGEALPEWSKVLDPSSGQHYYANNTTGDVTWDAPPGMQ